MIRLLVDIGNTRIKWALAEDNDIGDQFQFVWREGELETLLEQQWAELPKPDQLLISSVAKESLGETIRSWSQRKWSLTPYFAEVTRTSCGVTNSYPIPKKLGIDRWLAMLGAWDIYHQAVCVIDCGSAVTIDVLDKNGTHRGGMIAPGLVLSGRALTDHTYALTVNEGEDFSMLASDTEAAINSGCYHQFVGGVRYTIDKIQQQFESNMKYIITGGDAEIILAELAVDMHHEADLVLRGLILSSK